MDRLRDLRRLLTLLAFAFWFGGLSFHGMVVIPRAHAILRSHQRVGLITQQVTHVINGAAVVALALLLWELLARRGRALGWTTWALMAVAQAVLFALHPVLDGHLDPASGAQADPERFYALHRVYLLVTAAQWVAAPVHLWTWLRESRPSTSPGS